MARLRTQLALAILLVLVLGHRTCAGQVGSFFSKQWDGLSGLFQRRESKRAVEKGPGQVVVNSQDEKTAGADAVPGNNKHLHPHHHHHGGSYNTSSNSTSADKPELRSTVSRFSNFTAHNITAASNQLPGRLAVRTPLLLISITSGPHHAHIRHSIRSTWLLPCALSSECEYRFFIDAPDANITALLRTEQQSHGDLVFRHACGFMQQRHPPFVNYGNAQVSSWGKENVTGIGDDVVQQDYRLRRMYKIDWKICFLRWAREAGLRPLYHTFVEDDSFVCTENLLHQLSLLSFNSTTGKRLPADSPIFRTGTPMYDGFDDSSTIMSGAIADALGEHYLRDRPELNCSKVIDSKDASVLSKSIWMSWGNSWMAALCDWRTVLQSMPRKAPLPPLGHINEPFVDCLNGVKFVKDGADIVQVHRRENDTELRGPLKGLSFDPLHVKQEPLHFPCQQHRPLVYHASKAAEKLKEHHGKARMQHMCEYMLLVDKVKEPPEMFDLWNSATGTDYEDFSPVFLKEGVQGWLDVIAAFESRESAACRAGLHRDNSEGLFPNICMPGVFPSGGNRRLFQEEARKEEKKKEVLRRLHRRIHRQLFGAAAGAVPPPAKPPLTRAEEDEDESMYRLFFGGSRELLSH